MGDQVFCQIRVKGHLSEQWSDWFGGLGIENQPGGVTMFSGLLPDQAALYGVLNRMRDLGVALISLSCVEANSDGTLCPCQGDDRDKDRGENVQHQS